jgi:excisionase family DNA binding protein
MRDTEQETLLTVNEAAARLGVSRTRIFQYLASDELRGVSLGYRSRRILSSSIDNFIRRRLNEQEAEPVA